ncbi:hypothetical protein GCM10025879_14500 [Leuconostoc litchii]|uniref:DUF3290 domain-containing protein n=1 Tax=Leuconostoc litchii TaxID=1981069 RepID=A0A652NE77_9LACO|nr:DUF3290 domain-containing protein [Leuconostoc litchii]TYC46481.1 DUF3290 domain-containing protein [Leuconostoc litchii]GMA70204.1 hypothetical protein GCM10025879_14500 [Leuconostoc litchii]
MNFYSIDYLVKQTNINDTIGKYLMVIVFVLMAIGAVASVRNRLQTRYRELSIIALLLFLFLAGARYTDYKQAKSQDDQKTQMAAFATKFAKNQGVTKDKIYFNSTTVSDGMLVKIEQKYYKLTISTDQQSYSLTRAYLINSEVKVVK